MEKIKFRTVEEYFKTIPPQTLERMNTIRKEIKKSAPLAEEVISYNMPALRYNGILVYYAAYKNHIGFYPTSSAISKFEGLLSEYKWAKGSVQFPHDRPLPVESIRQMTKFRYEERWQQH